MVKEKIAIAIEKSLLRQIDSLIDGTRLKSRSQAISFFLQNGLRNQSAKKAAILLHKDHHKCALAKADGKSYIKKQLDLFSSAGVTEAYILTQDSGFLDTLKREIEGSDLKTEIVISNTKGTGDSLFNLREYLSHDNFILLSGDTFNDFDLSRMVIKHFESERLVTMGLVNKEKIGDHGVVLLDGTLVIDFEEKPKTPKSHIVNAGIYIFRPEIFEFVDENTISLEKDVFPKLARIKQLHGYFTHGNYVHISDVME